MYLQGVADFLDNFNGAMALFGFSLAVGSLLWSAAVLELPRSDGRRIAPPLVLASVRGLWFGSLLLAISAVLGLIVKIWIMASALETLPLAAYTETVQFKARALQLVLSIALLDTARRLSRQPFQQQVWRLTAVLGVALVLEAAWLSHAAGRLQDRNWLMFVTALHQAAAAAWIGGVFQLLWLRRLCRRDSAVEAFWHSALRRFARIGIPAVALLVATALPLAWEYVGRWAGLVGTAYGSLVLVKTLLLGATLGFAVLNFRAARRQGMDLEHCVPHWIEAEALLLVAVLFTAGTLSSLPPATDIPDATASFSEVAEMFAPRMPRLSSPAHDEFLSSEAARLSVLEATGSWASAAWSDFNHNVCGVFITLMAIAALLSYHPRHRWARHWPLGFIALGIFLFFRNDPQAWPMGPMGFWDSTLGDGEILQHRIVTLVTFAMGAAEYRARSGRAGNRLPYLFPLLTVLGGIILLTHGHAGFELKSEYLIKATHTALALLALVMGCGRWLELRLTREGLAVSGRTAGVVSCLALVAAGMILMFYREPIY